ncbi:MAG: DUF1778 domain-containing protein [Acidobacteriota bacterium]
MPIVKDRKIPKTRLDFRVSVESKAIIEQAASISGQTVSDFAVSTLVKSAQEVLSSHQQTRLSTKDFKLFLELLENNEEPNENLKKAAENHQKRVRN